MQSWTWGTLASAAFALAACSNIVTIEDPGGSGGTSSATSTTNTGIPTTTASTTTTTSTTTGPALPPPSDAASTSTYGGGPGSECGGFADPQDCYQCCLTDFQDGYNTLLQTLISACACGDAMAICNSDCSANICVSEQPSMECVDCINNKAIGGMDMCVTLTITQCQADRGCTQYLDCTSNICK